MKASVTHSVRFRNGLLERDGEPIFRDGKDFPEMIRNAYKQLGGTDRKFFKMDDLCKLGVLCSDALLQVSALTERFEKERIGVVLANAASSLETDRVHQRSVDHPETVAPSPAAFVYTLPNIVIGEICIRHGITGENAFFIFEGFEAAPLIKRVDALIGTGRVDACIVGWCEKDGSEYDGFFYTVEKEGREGKDPEHREDMVFELYGQSIKQ